MTNKISQERAKDVLITMYQEDCKTIDVLAVGPNAEVSVGQFSGIWHDFEDFPTVDGLIEVVNELHGVDLEAQRENAAA